WGMQSSSGQTRLSLWLMRQVIRLNWSGNRHPQTQGKVERFHGSLQRALKRRGFSRHQPQAWLDGYRWEHNHVRPHEALNMQTPASVWQPSRRRYDPRPSRWAYPTGAWVLQVDPQGRIEVKGRNWKISKALSGDRVQVVKVEDRMMVFYCATLMRELDLGTQRSTIIERWVPRRLNSRDVKDV
ncbi:MAG: integrase core domain-containing protein, partial [Acidobacteriia bacterium]|nr:integrase core domain-containing protein [Terriglobia bacterium]